MGVLNAVNTLIGEGRSFWSSGKQISWAITLTCELAFILFGIEQGVMGNLIDGDEFLDTFNHPTGSFLGIIVSIYTLGCFFGCILNFFVGDILGRRLNIMLAMVMILIGVALQTSAFGVPQLMIGRFLSGVGTGLETSTVPMYQSENCHKSMRGRLVCSEALFVGIGLVYAYWVTYGLSFVSGDLKWRLPIATQMIFAIIVFALCITVCESPRYLYKIGKKDVCRKNLAYVFGKPANDPEIVSLYNEIEQSMLIEDLEGGNWSQIFKRDAVRTRQRMILSYMSMFAQQLSGINLINYYITTVLIQNVGLDRNLAMILGGCCVICFTIGSLVPSFYSDKLGRRLPSAFGHACCGLCMMMVTILLSFQDDPSKSKSTGAASVAFFFLFQLVFGATANCIPWVIVPELLPLSQRSRGTALGVSANWLWNFFVVEITPTIISNITYRSYIIFTVTNLAFAVMFYLFYPEVKGLTLESVDTLFMDHGRVMMGFVDTSVYVCGGGDEENALNFSSKPSVQHVVSVSEEEKTQDETP
ncbi:Sugar transporter STL1 [Cyberlindnera fabianii]|uniref:Sugar transporter STL1 n=1 Tax=Cyberlindnera fabianii TaxID=36022 RepID=A0A1V2KZ77_CYBFA|nr:Sugar transporter STL1 [Cyberlindnera fabianii]